MKPYPATILNGFTLIILSAWGYFAAENGSFTALIPMAFGAVFLLLSNGIRNENRTILYILTVFSILVILSLYMPFQRSWETGNMAATIRILLMVGTGVIAAMAYIKSFSHFGRDKQ